MTEQELLQVPEELREIFRLLDVQGWSPRMCDTPVPFFDGRVPCGHPASLPACLPDGYILLPHDVPGVEAYYTLSVKGDSMKEAGIDDGDQLDVLATPMASDGDIVVAVVEGESTVKMFFTDQFGRSWLVPCNTDYQPMLMDKFDSAYVAGRVVRIRKKAKRGSYRELNYLVCQSPDYVVSVTENKVERMRQAVRKVASMVKQKRQWYAVYRALADVKAFDAGCYTEFVQMLYTLLPDHSHLPVAGELRRMEVQSFRRPVAAWVKDDAPVTGARFDAYVQIAHATMEAWG